MQVLNNKQIREELYTMGLELSKRFLDANKIPHPKYFTYDQYVYMPANVHRVYNIAMSNPLVGGLTGFYKYGAVCVNIPVTALPVDKPQMRSWSYPCWKTDRTAVGVVAHETGHYVEHWLQQNGKLTSELHGNAWRTIVDSVKKRVTSYEPNYAEAWAETLRLFILNPNLLQQGIPERYTYVRMLLTTSEPRTWRTVLNDHLAYCAAGERWITK